MKKRLKKKMLKKEGVEPTLKVGGKAKVIGRSGIFHFHPIGAKVKIVGVKKSSYSDANVYSCVYLGMLQRIDEADLKAVLV